MFPLLCMMYATSESNPGVRFFEYPLQIIKEQLDEMNEQNECCFIGLALIVIYNNKLYKHLLQNRNDQKFKAVDHLRSLLISTPKYGLFSTCSKI